MKILLATIDPDVAALRQNLLARSTFQVRGVTSAIAAANAVRFDHPEVAVLDIALPDIAGDEVARDLKADPAAKGTVLVLLVEDDEWMIERARSAGADHVLAKPVKVEDLEALLAGLLHTNLRKAVRVPIRIKIDGASNAGELRGESLDISATGMRMRMASCDFEAGFALWLKMQVSEESAPVICKAEVTRILQSGDGYQVGLKFVSFNGEGAAVLRRFLRDQGAA